MGFGEGGGGVASCGQVEVAVGVPEDEGGAAAEGQEMRCSSQGEV